MAPKVTCFVCNWDALRDLVPSIKFQKREQHHGLVWLKMSYRNPKSFHYVNRRPVNMFNLIK